MLGVSITEQEQIPQSCVLAASTMLAGVRSCDMVLLLNKIRS
jgi:hypothetical protein